MMRKGRLKKFLALSNSVLLATVLLFSVGTSIEAKASESDLVGEAKVESNENVPSGLIIRKFSCNKSTGQPVGTTIKFTAIAVLPKTPYYQFSVKLNNRWTVLKKYSTENTFEWTPTEAGTYIVRVMVKGENDDPNKVYTHYKDITFKITGEGPNTGGCFINYYGADKSTGQSVGTTVKFTARTVRAEESIYEFAYKFNGKWVTAQEYSDKNTFEFTPKEPGTYLVRVYAKQSGNPAKYTAYKDITFKFF